MAAFKPYKFIIFDKYLKHKNFYTQIISYLQLSLLCNEIYINKTFSKLNYEKISVKKLTYYSYYDLCNYLKDSQSQNGNNDQSHSNKNDTPIGTTISYNLAENEKTNNLEKSLLKNENKKKNTEEKPNEEPNSKGNKITKKNDIIGFYICGNNKDDEFLSILKLSKQFNLNHMNVLCLNNYKLITNAIRDFQINHRVSIYYPFYIIHDNAKNKNVQDKVKDFCYSIISDFLPLSYKHINLSDLMRAIILNSELCHNESKDSVEILKFYDIMEIIGKT